MNRFVIPFAFLFSFGLALFAGTAPAEESAKNTPLANPSAEPGGPSIVKVVGSPGSFRLERNGKDYFIKGVGGNRSLDLLTRCGGNSIRT